MKDEVEKWLVCKGYNHIDLPFSIKQRGWIRDYVRNPKIVAKHAFLPLMHRVMRTYPFKLDGTGKRKCMSKKRELHFASHLDAVIYGYYGYVLQEQYEKILRKKGIEEVVTAYRKIKSESHFGNKSNIDFANDVFTYIGSRIKNDFPLSVITFDIKGFFDNLDHRLLKNKLKEILDIESLSTDWYQIYKHVTNYSWVNEDEIFDLFKNKIKCKTKTGAIKEKNVSQKWYLRDKKSVAFCEKADLKLIRSRHLIHTRKEENKPANIGIPQGLPISSTLANVYMVDFDIQAKKLLSEVGGIYRRYSDDIIVVCPLCVGEYMEGKIREMINTVNLVIEPHKTNRYSFIVEDGRILCFHSEKGESKILTYLGFSYDGNRILLKNSSLSKFYYKMHQAVLRSLYFAIHINNGTKGKIFEHGLISRYTGAGSKSHKVYRRLKNGCFVLSSKRSYGNYLTYAYKSAEIMSSKEIIRQVSRCSNKLNKKIKYAKEQVAKSLYRRALYQFFTYGKTY